ncbi:MAG: hypothetical protein C5B55_09965 [Blastocatellia bacterium]|nr:MAG: hypothetical protein C5B55_09965 [Blastocatellia bacterium]
MKAIKLVKQVLPAALVILSAAVFALAQNATKHNSRPAAVQPSEESSKQPSSDASKVEQIKYSYEFSQPKFYVKHIVIEHDQTGRGTITFERLNEDTPVVEPLEISQTAMSRILPLWTALKFLDSDTNYQSSQSFAHLGTMKIGMEEGTRKRVAEFNWTHDQSAAALVGEYRKAADQAIFVFDISIARENQPLNAPKLMEGFESMLNRNMLSDPQQVLPLLKELTTDEHIPLIARNQALRLIKRIEKK